MITFWRRLFAFVAVLVLTASLTAGAAGTWGASDGMHGVTAMAGTAAPGCDDANYPHSDMTGVACYSLCGGTPAVLTAVPSAAIHAGHDLQRSAFGPRAGRATPPDPSPPRAPVLS